MKSPLTMKPSLVLGLQIVLLRHSSDAAFAPHQTALASSRNHYPLGRRRRRGQFLLLPAEPSAAPSSPSELIAPLPATPRQRHPLFRETNAVSKSMPVPHPDMWRKFLPAPPAASDSFWNVARNLLAPRDEHRGVEASPTNDVRVRFTDPAVGAHQLLELCGLLSSCESDGTSGTTAEAETLGHVTSVLSHFQSVAAPSDGPRDVACAARVVSTIGSAGAKCPIWHADYVPVRLILSLVGPGCECIPETVGGARIVDRGSLNNLDVDDMSRANDLVVPPALLSDAEDRFGRDAILKRAVEGEAVLLLGREWEDAAAPNDVGKVLAAVHRSPALVPGQERILLTVDLADWV